MPELPDVEIFRRYLEDTALNRTMDDVTVLDAGILDQISPGALVRRLKGRRFAWARRHGKHLLVAVDGTGCLTLHFGMSGSLRFFEDGEDQPRHTRVRFDFAADGHLAYVNVRRLGRVGFTQDADAFIRDAGLGPDAHDPAFDLAAFEEALQNKARARTKAFLMDQSAIAGIGNIYSDEILFRAGLHPDTKVAGLDREARRRLFTAMHHVLDTAIARSAGSEIELDRLPKDFLLPQRHEAGVCPRCGIGIARIKTGGRHAYFCPSCQKSP